MDESDMYNYPMVAADGRVGNLIHMVNQHVVVFDPATGEKKTAGPVIAKGNGTGRPEQGSRRQALRGHQRGHVPRGRNGRRQGRCVPTAAGPPPDRPSRR